jgi:hypothetical protein
VGVSAQVCAYANDDSKVNIINLIEESTQAVNQIPTRERNFSACRHPTFDVVENICRSGGGGVLARVYRTLVHNILCLITVLRNS